VGIDRNDTELKFSKKRPFEDISGSKKSLDEAKKEIEEFN